MPRYNESFWSKLVKFDKIADVLCYYAGVNAAYGDLSKAKKTHVRKMNPQFLQRMNACILEIKMLTQHLGILEAITSGGAWVNKPGEHSKGKAYDLGGLHWQGAPGSTCVNAHNTVLTCLEMANALHKNHNNDGGRPVPVMIKYQFKKYKLYLAIEAVLRRHFGTVIGIHYNRDHWNHWHIDGKTKVGYWDSGFGASSRVTFLQASLNVIWRINCGKIDGDAGKKTKAAIKELRETYHIGPLTLVENWKQYLLLTAMQGVGAQG